MAEKQTLFFDTECYVDYWLALFYAKNGKTVALEQYEGHPLDRATLRRILNTYRIVTFNGINYDIPMSMLAIKGASCKQLKGASDYIIQQRVRAYQFYNAQDINEPTIDHIDLIEPAPGVQISLKLYMGRMHAKTLQDLPYLHTDSITPDRREPLKLYCRNDCEGTALLFDRLSEQIHLREEMSEQYGLELRSKSDAQMAEAVIHKLVCEATHRNKIRPPELPDGTTFFYKPPKFVKFITPQFQEMLAVICGTPIEIKYSTGKPITPKEIAKLKPKSKAAAYKVGIGGLHSMEKRKHHIATDKMILKDIDVVSYYPKIILNNEYYPSQMGPAYLKVFGAIVEERITAKKAGRKVEADSKKIVINGSFGKKGNIFSSMYAPDLMIQVTLGGQLFLYMLIEQIEHMTDAVIVSANTDGIVVKCPIEQEAAVDAIVKEWEGITGFETEETRYKALYSRDVNNYIAIKTDGVVKTKGIYAETGLMKNPNFSIIKNAVIDYLSEGTPVEKTIRECQDIREFVKVIRADETKGNGGGAEFDDIYLGRVVRFYKRAGEQRYINRRGIADKVQMSDGAAPIMTYTTEFPDDIDYGWYIREAYDALRELGLNKSPPMKPIPIFF